MFTPSTGSATRRFHAPRAAWCRPRRTPPTGPPPGPAGGVVGRGLSGGGGRAPSQKTSRPARRISRAALRTRSGARRLLRIAHEADSLNFVNCVFSISTKNSLFPAGPSNGDSVTPRQPVRLRGDKSSNSISTRSWMAGSVMTPRPLSASALPASNCGLISAIILPSVFNNATAGGKIFLGK